MELGKRTGTLPIHIIQECKAERGISLQSDGQGDVHGRKKW